LNIQQINRFSGVGVDSFLGDRFDQGVPGACIATLNVITIYGLLRLTDNNYQQFRRLLKDTSVQPSA